MYFSCLKRKRPCQLHSV
uniref:Uncharacterized protein n=1 Tax=Anguilla anguilla TaxID=7936 RepID=A0A0E9TUW6_ANGAN